MFEPCRIISLCLLSLLLTSPLVAQGGEVERGRTDLIWGGVGLAQTESFWAGRAPLTPMGFIRYETFLPVRVWPYSPWESQLRFFGGLSGISQWRSGSTEFGDETHRVLGELGVAMGPRYDGSVFTLGMDAVAVALGGVDLFRLEAVGQRRTHYETRYGLAAGTGLHAGFKNAYLRQEILLGYGNLGYHHQLRLGLAVVF